MEVLGSRPNILGSSPAIDVLGSISCCSILGSMPADFRRLGSMPAKAFRSIPARDAMRGSIIAIIFGSICANILGSRPANIFGSIPAAWSILGSIWANILGSMPNRDGFMPPNILAMLLDTELRGDDCA